MKFPDDEQIKQTIDSLQWRLEDAKQQLSCEHEIETVSGPGGGYNICKKCGICDNMFKHNKRTA